jgi:hypothetical protein
MFISRIIPLYRQFARIGETADVFQSLAVCGDEVICAIRRHRIQDVYNRARPSNPYESRILLRRFDIPSGTFVSEAEAIMPVGEDPRCIVLRGRPYVLTPNSPGEHFNYVLFDVNARRHINVEVCGSGDFVYGKNWQPFVFDDELYAVHSFAPFRILHLDAQTGKAAVVFEKEAGMEAAAPHDRYSHFRGGGSALVVGDEIVGFGHFTIDSGRHLPFRWTFSPARQQFSLFHDVDLRFLGQQGYRIVDPTSFFSFRGKLYLGLSCSNRDWFYGQTFASFLLELESDTHHSLALVLNHNPPGPAASAEPAVPCRTAYFFRAAELPVMNGSMTRNFEVYSIAGQDQAGYVVHGPYIRLPLGKYRARVQYASPGWNWQEVGYIDVCVNSVPTATILAKAYLRGSEGALMFAEVDFEVPSDDQGPGIETRVYAAGIADLRITDVTIDRL